MTILTGVRSELPNKSFPDSGTFEANLRSFSSLRSSSENGFRSDKIRKFHVVLLSLQSFMIHLRTIRPLSLSGLVSLSMLAGAILTQPVGAQTPKKPAPQAQPAQPVEPGSNVVRPADDSVLSMQGGQRLMDEASRAVSAQNYPLAMKKLQEARQVYNQLSNFYQELATSFSGIDSRVADSQRKKALETAQMRDQSTYQLALVHRAMNQSELAVPLLVQIIRSQQPTRDLGKKAYQQLLEIGFVDVQFPRTAGEQAAPSANNR